MRWGLGHGDTSTELFSNFLGIENTILHFPGQKQKQFNGQRTDRLKFIGKYFCHETCHIAAKSA